MKEGDEICCKKELYRERCGYPLIVGKVYKIKKVLEYSNGMRGVIIENPHYGEKKIEKVGDVTRTTVFDDWMFYNDFNDDHYIELLDHFYTDSELRKMKLNNINKNKNKEL